MTENKIALLTRYSTGTEGTFGTLIADNLTLQTIEPPWKNNEQSVSCIPEGVYALSHYSSKKYPDVLEVRNVPNRTHILIHKGNWAGDKSKGLLCDSYGCILLGTDRGIYHSQVMVQSSSKALERFMEWYNSYHRNCAVLLKVRWRDGSFC